MTATAERIAAGPVASLRLHPLIDDSELHVFGRCGHRTQVERSGAFTALVAEFLTRGANRGPSTLGGGQ
ncbi:hypothetical protein B1R94_25075 [Mycolicibacterium litorale]|nr:hypothetical protein B1R94_25075 [Mycolicibacterium litorale]